mgnify:CR=1 FL=1
MKRRITSIIMAVLVLAASLLMPMTGILAGANVVMPNLSPLAVRKKYSLYNNKISTGSESAQCKAELEQKIICIGYRVVTERGDIKK